MCGRHEKWPGANLDPDLDALVSATDIDVSQSAPTAAHSADPRPDFFAPGNFRIDASSPPPRGGRAGERFFRTVLPFDRAADRSQPGKKTWLR